MTFELQKDQIPFQKQYVSVAILLLNVAVFILQLLDPTGGMYVEEAAFVPIELFEGKRLWTIFTSMFMHANFFHILMNMWFFYVVADNCEDAMGHWLFLLTYLVSGVCATLLHGFFTIRTATLATIPTLGASGAISGIIAVYGILFPNRRLALLLGFRFVPVKAKFYILFYFLMQVFFGFLFWGASSTAYFAHLGGFLAGAAFAFGFKLASEEF